MKCPQCGAAVSSSAWACSHYGAVYLDPPQPAAGCAARGLARGLLIVTEVLTFLAFVLGATAIIASTSGFDGALQFAVGSFWCALLAIITAFFQMAVSEFKRVGPAMACMTGAVVVMFLYVRQSDNLRMLAWQHRSLSNIRQLALAVEQYSNDYDGALPGWKDAGTASEPHYVHNVWDEQVDRYVNNKDAYSNGDTGIQSPSDPKRTRVLTYGLNGALIAGWRQGNGDWRAGPRARRLTGLSSPDSTILLAELATNTGMGGIYSHTGVRNKPTAQPSQMYKSAHTQWIDIDPRAWVENKYGDRRDYNEATWDSDRGVARDQYGGGAAYAFCDGHVEWERIPATTLGRLYPGDPSKNWSSSATDIGLNQWYPNP